jgi:NCAIR mutase (PurE)-related protein
MNELVIREILTDLQSGAKSIDDVLTNIRNLHYEDISRAKVDHHREERQGIPEVIFARGKSTEDVILIIQTMLTQSPQVFITKAERKCYDALAALFKESYDIRYNKRAGTILVLKKDHSIEEKGNVLVLSAGTSDIPVAAEAAETLFYLGSKATVVYDVGVAGIHRLIDHLDKLQRARAIIVVAGMEGALPSVVGGMTNKPVIAVPTSVGYGTSLGGLTALFAMLNSCVPGIAVMNIDNGFGAACLAHKINREPLSRNHSEDSGD